MDLSKVMEITIPQGKVVKITNASNIVLWSAGRIPSIYQEVEWVQAAANVGAYIDLGFSFDISAKIELSMYIVQNTSAYVFGAAENSGALRCMLSLPYSGGFGTLYGSAGRSFIGVNNIPYSLNTNEQYIFEFKKGILKAENKAHNYSNLSNLQQEYTMNNNMYLFAQNYNGSPRFGGARRVNYFKYYDKNNELICDLVPCYRKSDGVIGMYDTVRKMFLTNVGTGTFTKGSDV